MTGKLFIISASSGAGKTTLARELVKKLRSKIPIELIVGYTSREPREGEVEGYDYHFITSSEFQAKIAQEDFLEWNAGYGSYYGTSKDLLCKLQKGITCIAIIGIRSIETMLQAVPGVKAIWIMVTDLAELEKRLLERSSEREYLAQRIEVAKKEAEWVKSATLFHYKVINDDFDEAILELQNIVLSELEKK